MFLNNNSHKIKENIPENFVFSLGDAITYQIIENQQQVEVNNENEQKEVEVEDNDEKEVEVGDNEQKEADDSDEKEDNDEEEEELYEAVFR